MTLLFFQINVLKTSKLTKILFIITIFSGLFLNSVIIGENSETNNLLENTPFQPISHTYLENNQKNGDYLPPSPSSELNYWNESNYQSITSLSGFGNNFTVTDIIDARHDFTSNVVYTSISDTTKSDFLIEVPDEYNEESLEYNITSVYTIPDFLQVENSTSETMDYLSDVGEVRALAQSFEITSDYAVFYGAKIYLAYSVIGTVYTNLNITLVEEDIGGSPKLPNDALAYDLGAFYNDSNPLPESSLNETTDSVQFYDFGDVVLPKGRYFIVISVSLAGSFDPSDTAEYGWHKMSGPPDYGPTYEYNRVLGVWDWRTVGGADYNLRPLLCISDIDGTPLNISNFEVIDLKLDSNPISSSSGVILSSGVHEIETNTSVAITFNNMYKFSKLESAFSVFSASNSTYWEYTIDWYLGWETNYVTNTSMYNINRTFYIETPLDWDDYYALLYNYSLVDTGYRNTDGYLIWIRDVIIPGFWIMVTSSPNYVYNLNLQNENQEETNTYYLGYWDSDESPAIGYQGSTLTTEAFVRGKNIETGTPLIELSGTMNVTVFNHTGQIISINNSLPSNLIYNDTTFYSLAGLINIGDGRYFADISFDPSVYGTEQPGYRTVVVFWQNGTEVGIFAETIIVKAQTHFLGGVEILPGTGTYTLSGDVIRIGGDNLTFVILFISVTEPFFTSYSLIPDATVNYKTDWIEGFLEIDPTLLYLFFGSIDINIEPGEYIFTLLTNSIFYKNYELEFTLHVYHKITTEVESLVLYSHYGEDVTTSFFLFNSTFGENSSLSPDNLLIYLDGELLDDPSYYSYNINLGYVNLTIHTSSLEKDLLPDSYEIFVKINKTGFISDYYTTSANFTLSWNVLIAGITVDVLPSASEIPKGNNATVAFRLSNSFTGEPIIGADINVFLSEPDINYTVVDEGTGIYYINMYSLETPDSALEISVSCSKDGYTSVSNFQIKILEIKSTNYFLLVVSISSAFTVLLIVILAILYYRRKRRQHTIEFDVQLEKVGEIYSTVASLQKIIMSLTDSSLPIHEYNINSKIQADSVIISGFLKAGETMIEEISGETIISENEDVLVIQALNYRQFKVTSIIGVHYTIYCFTTKPFSTELYQGLRDFGEWFQETFKERAIDWDGDNTIFRDRGDEIEYRLFKYLKLWLVHSLVYDSTAAEIGLRKDTLSRQIVDLFRLKENEGAEVKLSVTEIIEHFRNNSKEEVIFHLLKLENIGVLKGIL